MVVVVVVSEREGEHANEPTYALRDYIHNPIWSSPPHGEMLAPPGPTRPSDSLFPGDLGRRNFLGSTVVTAGINSARSNATLDKIAALLALVDEAWKCLRTGNITVTDRGIDIPHPGLVIGSHVTGLTFSDEVHSEMGMTQRNPYLVTLKDRWRRLEPRCRSPCCRELAPVLPVSQPGSALTTGVNPGCRC